MQQSSRQSQLFGLLSIQSESDVRPKAKLDAEPNLSNLPSRAEALLFWTKAILFRAKRWLMNRHDQPQHYNPGQPNGQPVRPLDRQPIAAPVIADSVIAESVTALWTSHAAHERNLIAGKIHNLRVAARQIHGIELPAGAVFSFWAQVGKPTASRGYVEGRELRQGCIIPSIGGGLCQLSNALYSAALDAGLPIIERHAHTQTIPDSLAEMGRDATVFWNYVDLRFQAVQPLRIEVVLTAEQLIVRFKDISSTDAQLDTDLMPAKFKAGLQDHSLTESQSYSQQQLIALSRLTLQSNKSCQTCGTTSCFRNVPPPELHRPPVEATAYLLDAYWPEFDAYLRTQVNPGDQIAVPLDGKFWHKPNYAWNINSWHPNQLQGDRATLVTLRRALACRSLPAQGQSRQTTLLHYDKVLADWYAARLSYHTTHLVVMQPLLPFLWQSGVLGGRTFDVLMTRLPFADLHAQLDQAAQQHPDSPTLADFRADAALVVAEQEALQSARQIITPHRAIAQRFLHKVKLLDWHLPQPHLAMAAPGNAILFPASTLGRKGAYELRAVAQALNLSLRVWGRDLEGDAFWDEVNVWPTQGDPLSGVGLVVLPAYVEHCPRLLLRAIAAGIPVIASDACGLEDMPGVVTVPAGDQESLQAAVVQWLTQHPTQHPASV